MRAHCGKKLPDCGLIRLPKDMLQEQTPRLVFAALPIGTEE